MSLGASTGVPGTSVGVLRTSECLLGPQWVSQELSGCPKGLKSVHWDLIGCPRELGVLRALEYPRGLNGCPKNSVGVLRVLRVSLGTSMGVLGNSVS